VPAARRFSGRQHGERFNQSGDLTGAAAIIAQVISPSDRNARA